MDDTTEPKGVPRPSQPQMIAIKEARHVETDQQYAEPPESDDPQCDQYRNHHNDPLMFRPDVIKTGEPSDDSQPVSPRSSARHRTCRTSGRIGRRGQLCPRLCRDKISRVGHLRPHWPSTSEPVRTRRSWRMTRDIRTGYVVGLRTTNTEIVSNERRITVSCV